MKKGCAEGQSPFAGSLRVSLRYNILPLLARKGVRGMVERVFPQPARGVQLPGVPAFRGWGKSYRGG
jgi:hypothetical protein